MQSVYCQKKTSIQYNLTDQFIKESWLKRATNFANMASPVLIPKQTLEKCACISDAEISGEIKLIHEK